MGAGETAFGPFVLDRSRMALLRDGKAVAVGQRGYALLDAMLGADAVVDKAALLEAGWPGTIVEEGNLTVQIAALRKALGPREDGQEWIVTVPRVGYRLVRGAAAATASETPRLPTLAVLPFDNLSGDPEQQYFADGMVDELITALSRFRSFAVIARSSSFAYRGRSGDAREIALDLGVRYLLQGSVRRGGSRLRIAAQLVDGGDGATLWAKSFEGTLDDVFEFQDRITGSVASIVEPHIQRAELDHSRRERPGSLAAYDLFLRAVSRLYLFVSDDNAEAIRLLEQATQIEPENGLYLGYLVWALEHRVSMSWPEFGPDDEERCLDLARRAIELAPDDAAVLAHCGLAMQLVGADHDRGLLVSRRSVELNPNDLVALVNAGIAELIGGDLDLALLHLKHVVEIQPDSFEGIAGTAAVFSALEQHEEAIAWANRARSINSRYIPTYWTLVTSYTALGRLDAARELVAELLVLVPGLTVRHLARVSRARDNKRDQSIIDAMRLAGLPEGDETA